MRRSLSAAFAVAGLLLAGLVTAPPAQATTTTARNLALTLLTQAEGGSTTYSRAYFSDWIDADRDSCDTREEVLIAESRVAATVGSGCRVTRGRWYSWYDGATWTYPGDVDIDHVVALKEAWESGARTWSAAKRARYANDLGYSWSLDAVTDNVNASKGDRDPAQWLPPLAASRCTYVIHWVGVKYRWGLTIDATERSRILSILSGTCGARSVTIPARAA
jgi:hypothetical protein